MSTRVLRAYFVVATVVGWASWCCPYLCAQSTGVWKELPVPRIGGRWVHIDFADSANGWMINDLGEFVKTAEAGKTWTKGRIDVQNSIVAIKLYDSLHGIVVSTYIDSVSRLYSTTDGGKTFEERILPDTLLSPPSGFRVSILNGDLIGFISENLCLYTSTDAGQNWIRHPLPSVSRQLLNFLDILDSANIFIGGGDGMQLGFLFRSTDGGTSWLSKGTPVWASSQFYTKSLGLLWLTFGAEPDPSFNYTRLYNFSQPETSVTVSGWRYGALYEKGETFFVPLGATLVNKNPYSPEDSLFVFDTTNAQNGVATKAFTTVGKRGAWVLADSGRLFQRVDVLTDVSVNCISNNQVRSVPQYAVLRAFPNPFNGSCRIQLEVAARSAGGTLRVSDMLGRTVRSLFEGDLAQGKHEFVWTGSDSRGITLSSGIYYVTFSTANYATTTPVAYIK